MMMCAARWDQRLHKILWVASDQFLCVSIFVPNAAPNMRGVRTHTLCAEEIAAGRGRGAVLKRSEYNLF